MIVTFCGHSSGYDENETRALLDKQIESLIADGADTFYLGGYGQFDQLAAKAVFEAKKSHPEIRSILVIPYLNQEYDTHLYDETLYPPIEKALLRFAISKRNKWMVSEADVIISGVKHDWGGAAKTIKTVQRQKKVIISLFQTVG